MMTEPIPWLVYVALGLMVVGFIITMLAGWLMDHWPKAKPKPVDDSEARLAALKAIQNRCLDGLAKLKAAEAELMAIKVKLLETQVSGLERFRARLDAISERIQEPEPPRQS